MIRVFIAEEIPSLNKGESAILAGMLETFKLVGHVKVSMLSFHPAIDRERYAGEVRIIDGVKSLHYYSSGQTLMARVFMSVVHILSYIAFGLLYKMFGSKAAKIMGDEIWVEYLAADLIIIGHDGSFSLHGHSSTIFLTKLLRKPVVVYAGAMALFTSALEKALGRFILCKIDLITLRDPISYENVQKIGINLSRVHLTADTAFLLSPAPPARVEEIMKLEGISKHNHPLIGLTVTRRMLSRAFPNLKNSEHRYDKALSVIAQVIDYMVDEMNATIVLVPHCIGPTMALDDRIAGAGIYQKVKHKHGVRPVTTEYTAAELKGLIGEFDLFIGQRAHSVIAATSMHVPSIDITFPYDDRVYGIIGKMLGQENWIYDVTHLEFSTLVAKIDEAWLAKESIRADLAIKAETARCRALLSGELLKELLTSRGITG